MNCAAAVMLRSRKPDESRLGGRGLWFVNNPCDLVEIRSNPERGTFIRPWMYLPDVTAV
jgi:hypothetical protein